MFALLAMEGHRLTAPISPNEGYEGRLTMLVKKKKKERSAWGVILIWYKRSLNAWQRADEMALMINMIMVSKN